MQSTYTHELNAAQRVQRSARQAGQFRLYRIITFICRPGMSENIGIFSDKWNQMKIIPSAYIGRRIVRLINACITECERKDAPGSHDPAASGAGMSWHLGKAGRDQYRVGRARPPLDESHQLTAQIDETQ